MIKTKIKLLEIQLHIQFQNIQSRLFKKFQIHYLVPNFRIWLFPNENYDLIFHSVQLNLEFECSTIHKIKGIRTC